MTTAVPNTLFDRLVSRNLAPLSAPSLPVPSKAEAWGETIVEKPAAVLPSHPSRFEERISLAASGLVAYKTPIADPPAAAHMGTVERQTPPSVERTPAIEAPPPVRAWPTEVERVDAPLLNEKPRREQIPLSIVAPAAPSALAYEPRAAARIAPTGRDVLEIHHVTSQTTPMVQPDLPSTPVAAPRAEVAPAPPPEQIIHVTIGRLEVRSNERAKTAPARERRPAGPSLEQYLSGRRGGSA